VLAIVAALAGDARAQAKARSLAEELEGPARVAFEQGKELFEHQDYVTAHAKFGVAYEASRNPRLLWNMAASSSKQKRYAQAVAEAERYLSEGRGRLSADAIDRANAFLSEVRSYVAEATFTVEPAEARLFVDDEPRSEDVRRVTLLLELGRHVIRAERAGFEPLVAPLVVRDIGKLTVPLVLRPASPAAPASPVGVTAPPMQAPGDVSPAALPTAASVTGVTSPRLAPLEALPESREAKAAWWPWAAGGAALAAGLGISAYFFFKPQSIRDPYVPGTAAHFEVP
jgi:hypothetical protein